MFKEKLITAIKVRHSLIYIQTFEEERLITKIKSIGNETNHNISIWDFAKEGDPFKFLNKISSSENSQIYIMKDLYKFFKDDGVGIKLMRSLKNLREELKNQQKILIAIAPVIKIPEDIIRNFLILEDPLPSYEEIQKEIQSFLSRNKIGENISELLKDRIILSCLGLTIDQVNKILATTLLKNKKLDERCLSDIIQEKKNVIGQNQVLEFYDTTETISNIGGLDNLKNWLKIRSKAFSNEAKEYGLPHPKGLLMLGVQGTGKSLTAKAVASYWRLPLLKFDIGRVFGSLVGESENRIREALKVAETISPCILWVDEIDKAFAGLQGAQGDSGTSARVFGTLITWMQDKEKPVFIVATANDISKLPPELLRKGRFDEIFFVDIPNRREREEIFKIHIKKTKRDIKQYDLALLVESSNKFTGAEIEQAVKDAMYIAFADDERDFETKDILIALKETVPISQMMKEHIDRLREWANTSARFASITDKEKVQINNNDKVDFVY